MVIILIGVCGSGKSTVGRLLAGKLSLPFYDSDDFHPPANVAKMRSGVSLSEDDRKPWLARLAEELPRWEQAAGAVLAFPGQRESYRRFITRDIKQVRFVHLCASRDLLISRMRDRKDHYMPVSLLDDQLAIFEEPDNALVVDAALPPEIIVGRILEWLRALPPLPDHEAASVRR